jgi:hypothetical protein
MQKLTSAVYKCVNSACESKGCTRDLDVVIEYDTGAQYLRHEDERYCPDCLHPMEED